MSKFFINRPIFASVISIVIVLAGLISVFVLPVAQYPEITPPTVVISATYPGASAETLERTVAGPIEEQLSGIDNLMYFSSSSSANGTIEITASFEVGSDVDMATVNVNNRVKIAEPRLPDVVRQYGVDVSKRSNNVLLFTALTSPKGTRSQIFMHNYALVNVLDELKRVPGVGDASIFGSLDYSMRLWLDPNRMAQLGVTVNDIASAISAQNKQNAAGKIGGEPMVDGQQLVYTVTAKGRLVKPEDFGNIVIRAEGPKGVLRVRDVARVELGGQSYDAASRLGNQAITGIGVYLQSGANALDTSKRVHTKMEELSQKFPSDLTYVVPFDTTKFIQASIKEVIHTLIEALVLVAVVVFVFLQNWRATVIPLIAVPVSLVGTFAGLYLFGFSINTLTLFAMVLAIGIVVDDAIVVLENVERLMRDQHLNAHDAAVEAMREVSGAVVAIVLVLCSVFIPVAFLGGIAGQLYRQFAVTVAVSVSLSGVVALTLTPALCALLLKEEHKEPVLFKPFNRAFTALTNFYTATVRKTLYHRIIGTTACIVIIGGSFFMFRAVPGGFVPSEDQGYVISALFLPDGASLQRTKAAGQRLGQMVGNDPSIEYVFSIAGVDLIGGGRKTNAGTIFIPLKDWDKRPESADQIAKKIGGMGMMLPDGMALSFNPPAIQGLGSAGGFEVYIQAKDESNPKKLAGVVQNLIEELKKRPELTGISTFFRPSTPQLRVDVDEDKAIALGVPVAEVYQTLQATMGALYINDFNLSGRTYRVQLQADAPWRSKPTDIGKIHVRSTKTGAMIPASALVKVQTITGAEQLERFNGFLAAKIHGDSVPGVSTGEAIKIVEAVMKESLPEGYDMAWTGQAFQEKRTGTASAIAFGFGILMVFLILAAQYERWSLPLAVIMAVPFGLFGALASVMIRGMPNDIYFQIGLVVLIGLAAKNAILIVEFAAQKRAEGMKVRAAALEGARLRFRPIVMTSLAFILGVFPLVKASGAGAAARQSMGTGVFGGMLAATFIATIFIPMFFSWLSGKRPGKHEQTAEKPASQESGK